MLHRASALVQRAFATATSFVPAKRPRESAACIGLLLCGICSPARADTWFFEPSIKGEATESSNANFGENQQSAPDTITEVAPSFVLRAQGSWYQIYGTLLLDYLEYARGTERDRFLPSGSVSAHTIAIPETVYLDTGLTTFQNPVDPFGVHTSALAPSSNNTETVTQYRLTPYIDRQFNDNVEFLLRSENSYSHVNGADETVGSGADGYFGKQTISLEGRPAPLGWRISAIDQLSSYSNVDETGLREDTLRGMVDYLFDAQMLVGVSGGYEHSQFAGTTINADIYGLSWKWYPTERTSLQALVEHRFFGSGWDLGVDHHTHQFAVKAHWTRDASTYLQSIGTSSYTTSLTGLLDSILGSEYTDPVDRTRATQQLLNQKGLPNILPDAAGLITEAATVINSASGTLLYFLNARDTVSLTLYRTRSELLSGEGLQFVSTLADVNNVQYGGAVNFAHRVSPLGTVNLTLLSVDTRALAAESGESTKQRSIRLEYNEQLSPGTTALVGVRHQLLTSNVVQGAVESAIYVGLSHRF